MYTNIIELHPIDNRKSFYGKALVIREGNRYALRSYSTIVCAWDDDKKEFTRYWDGYSVTTMRHVNSFMRFLGFSLGGKAWWDELMCDYPYSMAVLLNI